MSPFSPLYLQTLKAGAKAFGAIVEGTGFVPENETIATAFAHALGLGRWTLPKKAELENVLANVKLPGGNPKDAPLPKTGKSYLPATPLSLGNFQFPSAEPQGDVRQLWARFQSKSASLAATGDLIEAENLLALLRMFASRLRASDERPDVSLYEHVRLAAGMAICLERADDARQPYLLLGGDLSGIQNYIYNIQSKSAAKNLKGRSFFLQLLVESAIRLILSELGLAKGNIVYASGGGFFLLAPNSQAVKDRFEQVRSTLQQQLFDEYRTQLFMSLHHVPVATEDVVGGTIEKAWNALHRGFDKQKQRRFQAQIQADYAAFFEPTDVGGLQTVDDITGEEILEGKGHSFDGDGKISYATKAQIALGKVLREAKYWVVTPGVYTGFDKDKSFSPLNIGFEHHFVKLEELMDRISTLPSGSEVFELNPRSEELVFDGKGKLITGFAFYGGNDMPWIFDSREKFWRPKSFDELAFSGNAESTRDLDKDQDLKRIAVLRMDVDNLGQIFINGMEKGTRGFARYATLSASLDVFFMGYLNTIRDSQEFQDNSIIVYAGGDDIFVVGKWDKMIEMARQIRQGFGQWTGENPFLTLSGGITIVTDKFPIMRAAQMADKDEKKAKKHTYKGLPKDSISLFGKPLRWREEFENEVMAWRQELVPIVEGKSEQGFLQRLQEFYHQKEAWAKANANPDSGTKANPKWQWRMVYTLARMKEQHKGNVALVKVADEIIAKAYQEGPDIALDHLAIAARWMHFVKRERKDQQ